MQFIATPLLSSCMLPEELPDVLAAAQKSVEVSGATERRFDAEGNPTTDGDYETWLSADGTHQIVSFS